MFDSENSGCDPLEAIQYGCEEFEIDSDEFENDIDIFIALLFNVVLKVLLPKTEVNKNKLVLLLEF